MPSPDLAQKIRDDIEYRRGQLLGSDPGPFAEIAFDGMRDAILGVLELHRAVGPHKGTIYRRIVGDYAGSKPACARCGEWPCSELLAIAKALGIEVD